MLWYSQVVFRWRTAASIFWLLLVTIPVLLVFRVISSCSLLHPFTWITGCINDLLTLSAALSLSLYLLMMIVISLIYSTTYTVKLPVYKSRLSVMWSVLQPAHFAVTLLFAVVGGGCGFSLAQLAGYRGLWITCYGTYRCINEYQLFCTLYGAFSGFLYGVSYYINKEYFLVFPSIQQNKLFRLRGHVKSHLWEGLVWNFKILKYYYPLYYFLLGPQLCSRLMRYLNLYRLEGAPSLSSLSGLLDLGLLLHLLLAGTLLRATWSFGLRLFRTFHTEALQFPVVAMFSGDAFKLLTSALQAKTTPILMHLGYLDLYLLSIHSAQQHKKVYSLDQSGQPVVWNIVHSECLTLINSMTTRLSTSKKLTNGIAGPGGVAAAGNAGGVAGSGGGTSEGFPPTTSLQAQSSSPPSQKGWSSLPAGYYSPPGVTRRIINDEKARLWSYSPGVERVGHSPPAALKKPQPSICENVNKKWSATKTKVKSIPHHIAERLKRKPFFTFFLSELPDTVNQELYSDSQLQVWAIIGLSELVSASYAEDSYGVVQRTLPSILAALLNLSQALDKHVKSPLSSSKSTRNVRVAMETNGRYAVKTALQTSLHRLGMTFIRERRALQLSNDHLHYWNSFLGTETRH